MKLTDQQIADKKEFVNKYIGAENAATGSELDANANFDCKNVNTLSGEIWKDFNAQMKRSFVSEFI